MFVSLFKLKSFYDKIFKKETAVLQYHCFKIDHREHCCVNFFLQLLSFHSYLFASSFFLTSESSVPFYHFSQFFSSFLSVPFISCFSSFHQFFLSIVSLFPFCSGIFRPVQSSLFFSIFSYAFFPSLSFISISFISYFPYYIPSPFSSFYPLESFPNCLIRQILYKAIIFC